MLWRGHAAAPGVFPLVYPLKGFKQSSAELTSLSMEEITAFTAANCKRSVLLNYNLISDPCTIKETEDLLTPAHPLTNPNPEAKLRTSSSIITEP